MNRLLDNHTVFMYVVEFLSQLTGYLIIILFLCRYIFTSIPQTVIQYASTLPVFKVAEQAIFLVLHKSTVHL